jgi:acyl-CoA thioester hydrolase
MREPREERRADFPYSQAISSRWQDCDAYGHVNNVVYYSWFDTAVTTLLMQQRVIWLPDSPTIGLCVESHCRFFAPIEFPETVDVAVRIARIGQTSVRYELAIFREGVDAPAAAGHFVHVMVDRATRRPAPINDAHRAVLQRVCWSA